MSLSISFRSSTDTDLEAALAFLQRDAAGPLTAAGYRAGLDAGEYRLDWTWLAVDENPEKFSPSPSGVGYLGVLPEHRGRG